MSFIAASPGPPKPLRFVNNDGQPPPKRRRINAACRTCRKRKTRCDGQRPICLTCTEGGHDCLGYALEGGDIKRETKGLSTHSGADNDVDAALEEGSRPPEKSLQSADQISGNSRRGDHCAALHGHIDAVPRTPKDWGNGAKDRNAAAHSRDVEVFSDEKPQLERPIPSHTESHRVPYFRYFGPTAIVPGFKQMVVSVREHRRSTGAASSEANVTVSPGSGGHGTGSVFGGTATQAGTEPRSNLEMPNYDQNDTLPVHRLIIHLVDTFFAHLGCNYPFLQQRCFLQRVEERVVEAILVDAICALSARFSDHPLLTASRGPSYPKSEYGQVFAQRAKSAVVHSFPRPTVAATQACLLLAYESFGSNQDSALWMYLGCAIRMAVDLGLQKLDGVKYQGQKDPGHRSSHDSDPFDPLPPLSVEETMDIEQERINTLWAVFMLDRVISSGTGRPVTLRDDDFELSFPAITTSTKDGWPDPFPALIQIIHLYGRVSDLLNNITTVQDVTPEKINGLISMEKDLTQLYQKLDTRLNFNAANFQHYCKAGSGTNFILVHFWFHTLIMLLHQPTLMHSFEGQIISLLPNSRELSMSSAKTIADILAFAELIDPRSFIGNPFTSQPMYIAACAFLMESAAHTSNPTSRGASPPISSFRVAYTKDKKGTPGKASENNPKHSLLASAANQNYQRCYQALQQLEIYWAGTRYILVALDQKAKGIWDPETYTEQEYEATKSKHDIIPDWRRKISLAGLSTPGGRFSELVRSPRIDPGSPSAVDPSQAIGWALTGTTNSPSSNLTFMYQMSGEPVRNPPPPVGAGNMVYDPIRSSLPESAGTSTSTSSRYQAYQQQSTRPLSQPVVPLVTKYTPMYADSASASDAEMLLGLQNPPFPRTPGSQQSFEHAPSLASPLGHHGLTNSLEYSQNSPGIFQNGSNGYMGLGGGVGEMTLESQEIDMSALGGEMVPWLEYLPQNMLDFFDTNNVGNS